MFAADPTFFWVGKVKQVIKIPNLEVREMRNAEKILSIISKRGKNKKPLQRIYRLLYNPQLYLTAYQNIYANKGAMTKGANNETADGMSIQKIADIINKLKTETYRWTPVKRIYTKKDNGKQRPLGLPTWSDKLLQEVIRLILDAYYDNQFSNYSHGFRTGRGCKTALETLTYKGGWTGVKWFIEGDISNCFGSLDHQILMNILKENIADNRFLRLIENYLKNGYLEDWKYNETLTGCPQGGILSPLLSNIYMDKLDQYVEHTLMPKYTTGKNREPNQEYKTLLNQKRKYKHQKNWKMVKEIKKITQKMPSKNPIDKHFRRLHYIRYCDDWLLGFSGSKKEAEDIKTEIAAYLQTNLNLHLSQEKTFITHARNGRARFLGYDIHMMHQNTKHDKTGRRVINGKTGLQVPREKMRSKMSKYMAKGKPVHRQELATNSDYDIISQYQSEYRGFVQYYLYAYNASQMYDVKWAMEFSLVRTLANKHKTTRKKVLKRYRTIVETGDGAHKVLQVKIEREGKMPLVAQFGGIKLACNKDVEITDACLHVSGRFLNSRSQLIDRLTRNVCELCGSIVDVQMHHVKKLKDLRKDYRRDRPEWVVKMIAMNRKTLAVCVNCHCKIHSGTYDGVRVC